MAAAELIYMAYVPVSRQVYLKEPVVAVPTKPSGQGRRAVSPRVVSEDKSLECERWLRVPQFDQDIRATRLDAEREPADRLLAAREDTARADLLRLPFIDAGLRLPGGVVPRRHVRDTVGFEAQLHAVAGPALGALIPWIV